VEESRIVSNRRRFVDWVAEFSALWTHIHLTVLALRCEGKLIAVGSTVVLADEAECSKPRGVPIVETPDVLAFRVPLAIHELDRLLDAVSGGVLKADMVPGLREPVFFACPAGDLPKEAQYQPHHKGTVGPWELLGTWGRWPRAELLFTGQSLADGSKSDVLYTHLESVDRRFPKEGHGSLGIFTSRLGLRETGSGHFDGLWRYATTVRFVAPLFVRLDGAHLDRERQTLSADVEVGRRVPRDRVYLSVLSNDLETWIPARQLGGRGRHVSVILARGLPFGTATVHLTFDPAGQIGEETVEIKPPPRPWPLAHALRKMTDDLNLVREGLNAMPAKDGQAHDPGAEFDRAIHMLLASLDYASVWWGTGRKVRPPRALQPGAEVDSLAYHRRRNEFLVVECTIGHTGGDKIHKLVGRSLLLNDWLKDVYGSDVPMVRPVLAVAIPESQVPPATLGALRENGAALLSLDRAQALLKALDSGQSPEEVDEMLDRLFAPRTVSGPRRMRPGGSPTRFVRSRR
jgi:hypothetical protein